MLRALLSPLVCPMHFSVRLPPMAWSRCLRFVGLAASARRLAARLLRAGSPRSPGSVAVVRVVRAAGRPSKREGEIYFPQDAADDAVVERPQVWYEGTHAQRVSESTTEGGGERDGSTEAEGGETAKRKGHYRRLQ